MALDTAQNLPTLSEIRRIPAFKSLKPTQLRMISALVHCDLQVVASAQRAGVDWRSHYHWLQKDNYKAAFAYAKEILADTLESTMLDHAIIGRETPIIYKGEITGSYREVNSYERITLLKGLRPQYRENYALQSVAGPVQVHITMAAIPAQMPAKEIDVSPPTSDK